LFVYFSLNLSEKCMNEFWVIAYSCSIKRLICECVNVVGHSKPIRGLYVARGLAAWPRRSVMSRCSSYALFIRTTLSGPLSVTELAGCVKCGCAHVCLNAVCDELYSHVSYRKCEPVVIIINRTPDDCGNERRLFLGIRMVDWENCARKPETERCQCYSTVESSTAISPNIMWKFKTSWLFAVSS
jgi:hypothetical protein